MVVLMVEENLVSPLLDVGEMGIEKEAQRTSWSLSLCSLFFVVIIPLV